LVTLVNDDGKLASSYVEFNYPGYGTTKKEDIVMNVRMWNWYDNPMIQGDNGTPLYYKLIFRDECKT